VRKIIVFKHVAQENLGSLKGVLTEKTFRIRYVNFDRDPEAAPELARYQGLVVLGGWMGVYEADRYPHLVRECRLIEEALKREMPVLGICLGAQILAHVLGAGVRKAEQPEVGWRKVCLRDEGRRDPVLGHFRTEETLFQMHGDTFELPAGAEHLAYSQECAGQAFRYGTNAYGLQFHLEADLPMIRRFLREDSNREELLRFGGDPVSLESDTRAFLGRSLELSRLAFSSFLGLFGPERSRRPPLDHGRGR
jgi:GMP synthase (glutamine-hydrolysing)